MNRTCLARDIVRIFVEEVHRRAEAKLEGCYAAMTEVEREFAKEAAKELRVSA